MEFDSAAHVWDLVGLLARRGGECTNLECDLDSLQGIILRSLLYSEFIEVEVGLALFVVGTMILIYGMVL